MDEQRFISLMRKADTMRRIGDRPDYWAGYQRGLRRAHHGERFGTEAEHELWLSLIDRTDSLSQERGVGYRDGLLAAISEPEAAEPGLPPAEAVHAYLKRHGITGAQAARMMYLSGARQVRKYTGGESPRQMDGARWFCLHAHMMLSAEQIAEIEAAMEADCAETE